MLSLQHGYWWTSIFLCSDYGAYAGRSEHRSWVDISSGWDLLWCFYPCRALGCCICEQVIWESCYIVSGLEAVQLVSLNQLSHHPLFLHPAIAPLSYLSLSCMASWLVLDWGLCMFHLLMWLVITSDKSCSLQQVI